MVSHWRDQTPAALTVGSRIALRQTSAGAWRLCDAQGVDVGALSQHFEPETHMHGIEARVATIHVRRPRDVAETYQSRSNAQCESWEMLVPELVYAPGSRRSFTSAAGAVADRPGHPARTLP